MHKNEFPRSITRVSDVLDCLMFYFSSILANLFSLMKFFWKTTQLVPHSEYKDKLFSVNPCKKRKQSRVLIFFFYIYLISKQALLFLFTPAVLPFIALQEIEATFGKLWERMGCKTSSGDTRTQQIVNWELRLGACEPAPMSGRKQGLRKDMVMLGLAKHIMSRTAIETFHYFKIVFRFCL